MARPRKQPTPPATHRTPWPLENMLDPAGPPEAVEEVGAQFNRAKVAVFPDGRRVQEMRLQPHYREIKARSILILEEAGIPVPENPKENPDRLRAGDDAVLGVTVDPVRHPYESAVGIAARLLFLCIRLERYEAEGAPVRHVIPVAQALGMLDFMAKVYGTLSPRQAEASLLGAEARKIYSDEDRARWWELWCQKKARNPSLKPSSTARTIAKECGHEPAAVRTIRDHLRVMEEAVVKP